MAEFKPCPFCGQTPKLVTCDVEPQGDAWYGKKVETFVLCDCGCCLFDGAFHDGFYDAETRAVAAWNARAERAEAAQPVAWIRQHPDGTLTKELLLDSAIEDVRKTCGAWVPLAPVAETAQRVPLTEAEFEALVVWKGDPNDPYFDRLEFARAIERKVLGVTATEPKGEQP